jgi:hypothetical protein
MSSLFPSTHSPYPFLLSLSKVSHKARPTAGPKLARGLRQAQDERKLFAIQIQTEIQP